MLVHLNGRLVDGAEAVVSVFDRGFLFGDGVFESMRACAGRVFRLERHLDRLERSAALAGFEDLPLRATLAAELAGLLRANHLEEARIRLTVTRGPGRPGDYVSASGPPTRVATAAPFAALPAGHYAAGVEVALAPRRAVPVAVLDPAIKTTSRLAAVLARREARTRGAFEALLTDADDRLTEGTASNLFLVQGRRLATPAAPAGALPGVTRGVVLEVARAAGLAIDETPLPVARLSAAEEIFLTNTSWEVLPVVRVDGRAAGGGRPGPVTLRLLDLYRNLLRRECGAAAPS